MFLMWGLVLMSGISLRVDAETVYSEDSPQQFDQAVLTNLELSTWTGARLDDLAVAPELGVAILPSRLELKYALSVSDVGYADGLPPEAWEYVARLKPIFLAEGVPAELVWLAEVESKFDTLARSPIGAVGLFQLMPDTATSLGLALAPWDQRLQPEKNARAAARYLKVLHGMFHDWRLAIAAYNGGEGLVGRLLERRGAHSYDEIAAELPTETQTYVPKVEVIILRREGVALKDVKPPKAGP
jgi:transglycosylase-like protein with SLT domain